MAATNSLDNNALALSNVKNLRRLLSYSRKIWQAIYLAKCPILAFGEFYTWQIANYIVYYCCWERLDCCFRSIRYNYHLKCSAEKIQNVREWQPFLSQTVAGRHSKNFPVQRMVTLSMHTYIHTSIAHTMH